MLNPEEIESDFSRGILTKKEAIEKLIILLEHDRNDEIRLECIKALEGFKLDDKNLSRKVFKSLEHCLLSDVNVILRKKAAKIILTKFSDQAEKTISWILQNENREICKLIAYLSIKYNYKFFNQLKEELIENEHISYIYEGVNPNDSFVLWLLETLDGIKLRKVDLHDDVPCVVAGYSSESYYKIHDNGYVFGLYLTDYADGAGGLPIIPTQLSELNHLREIYLRSYHLKTIPDFIRKKRNVKILKNSYPDLSS